VRAAAYFESQRCGLAFLAKTDLSACGFTRQVTLLDNVTTRAPQFVGQPLKQKFAFDFPIVYCPSIFLHNANMLNATSLLSRFSRWRENPVNALPKSLKIGFTAGIGDSGYKNWMIKSVRAGKIRVMRLRLQGLARLRSPRLSQRTAPRLQTPNCFLSESRRGLIRGTTDAFVISCLHV
jgi:hypothetical protein